MPDLTQSLQGRDLGHLKIIAELWGIEFSAPDARVGLQRIIPLLLNEKAVNECLALLPEGARAALGELTRNEGRVPWAAFERRYGVVREMGAARRDREKPYLDAHASAAEALWYRGLIGKNFFDTPSGPQEFAYIPDDLLPFIPIVDVHRKSPMGRLATPAEKSYLILANDHILDDACTFLAALRSGEREKGLARRPGEASSYFLVANPFLPYPLTLDAFQILLAEAQLLDERGAPQPDAVRRFLEAERGEALLWLTRAWLRSPVFNDLLHIPHLAAEGEWKNDPLRARSAILDYLSTISGVLDGEVDVTERPFWSLGSLVNAVRQSEADFLRSAGEYDSWYIRDLRSGNYLRGFEHWDHVEGELIRFMIGGPLYWLGVVDLGLPAAPAVGETPLVTSFRFSRLAQGLLNLSAPGELEQEGDRFQAATSGRLRIPILTKRSIRYQTARFTEWEGIVQDCYQYRITPKSLSGAQKQGLRVAQLKGLLLRHAQPTPPKLIQALEHWEAEGSMARVDQLLVLRVKRPELLDQLRKTRLARYLGEALSPTVIVVRRGSLEKLLDGLVEMGYFGEVGDLDE
jgi:hypothetical protein